MKDEHLLLTQMNPAEQAIIWHFFGHLPPCYRLVLLPLFDKMHLAAGERLIQQGTMGETLYIVLNGRLQVVDETLDKENQLLTMIEEGEGVGEIAFLTGERRTASVNALTKVNLVTLSRTELEKATSDNPEARQAVFDALRDRVHQSRLNHVLKLIGIFKNLDRAILDEIQAELRLQTVVTGERVMSVGEEGDSLYIVVGGRLQVFPQTTDLNASKPVEVFRGQTVGEMSLISNAPRTANVVALRESLLARLSKASFKRLLQKYPEAMLTQFVGPIINRLRHQIATEATQCSNVTTIALIPVSSSVPLEEFAKKLTQALRRLGSAIAINSERCGAVLGLSDIAYSETHETQNARLIFWLNEQEAAHDYVLYEADVEPTLWTERCIRQADLLLLVGNADDPPDLSPVERRLLSRKENAGLAQCLVLLHDAERKLPVGTKRWLAQRHVRDHYHLCWSNEADFMRIGRLVTGQGIGLVLSGGGARCMAHIGVVQALNEQNIPIDAVCGASGGAVFGGLYALGIGAKWMLSKTAESIAHIDYTLPLHALTNGKNFTDAMRSFFGNVQIEDLWTTYFCISSNLTQAGLTRHQSGSLMHAVRASCAIPGILPPVYHDNDILVDGGLINNMPADLMMARPDIGYIIAVNVSGESKQRELAPFDYEISGWKSLWQRLNPWATGPAHPSIGEVLMRSISIASAQTEESTKQLVDLYLTPPVQQFNMLDFQEVQKFAEIGYGYGREAVAQWHQEGVDKLHALLFT